MTAPGRRECPLLELTAAHAEALNGRRFPQLRVFGDCEHQGDRQLSNEAGVAYTDRKRHLRTSAHSNFRASSRESRGPNGGNQNRAAQNAVIRRYSAFPFGAGLKLPPKYFQTASD